MLSPSFDSQRGGDTMAQAPETGKTTYGTGAFTFSYAEPWAKMPNGMSFLECPGVAVDSQDNVYVLTRGEHPIMVFDKLGNFLRSFGEGNFTNRTHGLYIAHDDSLLVADDALHTIQKF